MRIARPTSCIAVREARKRLLQDIRDIILAGRERVAVAVNAGQLLLYWHIVDRIAREVLRATRATYGEEIGSTVSKQLAWASGQGFSKPKRFRMSRLARMLPDRRIVASLSEQLGWSHLVEIIPLKDPLQREFYAEMCRIERPSVRRLPQKIGSMLALPLHEAGRHAREGLARDGAEQTPPPASSAAPAKRNRARRK